MKMTGGEEDVAYFTALPRNYTEVIKESHGNIHHNSRYIGQESNQTKKKALRFALKLPVFGLCPSSSNLWGGGGVRIRFGN